jgi:hypothetical protein
MADNAPTPAEIFAADMATILATTDPDLRAMRLRWLVTDAFFKGADYGHDNLCKALKIGPYRPPAEAA